MKEELIPQSIPLSDTDLLMLISWKEDNLQKATEAFNLLYNRYAPYLHPISINVCKTHQPHYVTNLADRVIWNTFAAIWEYPDEVIKEIDDAPATANTALTTKAVLGRLAKTELLNNILPQERRVDKGLKSINYTTAEKLVLLPDSDQEEPDVEQSASPEEQIRTTQETLELHSKAMTMLTAREQDIIKTMMISYKMGCQMPDAVNSMLCERYEILPDNLRQIKSRAMKKLKDNKEILLDYARTISQK
jgi:hypothetical protein